MVEISSARDYERDVRRLLDAMFERPVEEENPVLPILDGRASREEVGEFFSAMWPSLLVFNRLLLPSLLMKAPTHEARVRVSHVIAPEYGESLESAHPTLFLELLGALGVCPPRVQDPLGGTEAEWLGSLSWPELIGRILVGESIGPKIYDGLADALVRRYGISASAVGYFTLHARHDKKDTEVLFELLRETVTAPTDRELLVGTIRHSFGTQPRYRAYGTKLPIVADYSYLRRHGRRRS